MKLKLPLIMHIMESTKPIMFASRPFLEQIVHARDRERRAFVGKNLPLLHKSQKFIFDSGADRDMETVMAIRETGQPQW